MVEISLIDVQVQENSYYGEIEEPVSLDEAKKHLIVTYDDDDDYITELISQCRQQVEDYTHTSIVPKTVTVTISAEGRLKLAFSAYDNFEYGKIELPFGPVISDVQVTRLYPQTQSIEIMQEGDTFVILGTQFKKIGLTPGEYLLIYQTGYGTGIPRNMKLAIFNEIAFRYEKRGDESKRYNADQPGICAASQALVDKLIRIWQ